MKQVRVLRMIEYVGNEDWMKIQIEQSIHGVRKIPGKGEIRVSTIGIYPEVLENLPEDKRPNVGNFEVPS